MEANASDYLNKRTIQTHTRYVCMNGLTVIGCRHVCLQCNKWVMFPRQTLKITENACSMQ